MKSLIRIGTRGSQLARYQAEVVKTRLEKNFPLLKVKTVIVKTSGDMIRRGEPRAFDTKRIYTREIEEALLKGDIDVAVHSAKDMSVVLPEKLKIGAVLEREDPRDCLISKEHKKLSELPLGSRVGTSAIRRKLQLLRLSPEVVVEEIHGNVDSRIRKMQEDQVDALVLAYAGMKRLGLENFVTEIFDQERFYPSPGQGAIVAQSREQDPEIDEVLVSMNHKESALRLFAERSFLLRLEGGCQLPCGIRTSIESGFLKLSGALFSLDGDKWVEASHEGSLQDATNLGRELADIILTNGGQEILDCIRHQR